MQKMTNLIAMNYVIENCELPVDVAEKLENMRNSLVKKSATRSKASREKDAMNENIANIIAEVLTDAEPMTVSEINRADDRLTSYSNQKLSAILRKMIENGTVEKAIAEKPKRTVFSLA